MQISAGLLRLLVTRRNHAHSHGHNLERQALLSKAHAFIIKLCVHFLECLMESVDFMPYTLRWIACCTQTRMQDAGKSKEETLYVSARALLLCQSGDGCEPGPLPPCTASHLPSPVFQGGAERPADEELHHAGDHQPTGQRGCVGHPDLADGRVSFRNCRPAVRLLRSERGGASPFVAHSLPRNTLSPTHSHCRCRRAGRANLKVVARVMSNAASISGLEERRPYMKTFHKR